MKERKISIFVLSMSVLGVGAAQAADLSMPPVTPMVIHPIFTWTGARIGGFGGYGISSTKATNIPAALVYKNTNGWLGGVLIGYDYQIGSFVVGALADFAGAGMKGRIQSAYNAPLTGSKISINYVGTVRARFGYAVDRALIAATVGWGYLGVKGSFPGMTTASPNAATSYQTTQSAWTVGGSIDYAVTDSVIANLDYLFLGPPKFLFATGYANFNNGFGISIRERVSIIRGGIAYKF
jgi:outer membrane immunogenic protein